MNDRFIILLVIICVFLPSIGKEMISLLVRLFTLMMTAVVGMADIITKIVAG